MENAKISPGSLFCLLNMLFTTVVASSIGHISSTAKFDAWLAALFALVFAYVIMLLAINAGPLDTNTSMPDWIEQLLGVFLGRIINILYLLFFLINGSLIMRSLIEIVGLAVLPLTPRAIILGLFALPIGMTVRLGVETITRTAQVFIFISLSTVVLILISLGSFIELFNLQPILADGIRPVAIAAVPSTAMLSLIVVGLWFSPYLQKRQSLRTVTGWSLTVIGLLFIVETIYSQGIFGYRGAGEMLFPLLNLVRSIRIGRVFERLDVILLAPWILGTFLIITLFTYLACQQLAWIGGTKHYRSFTFPLTVLVAVLSIVIVGSDAELTHFINIGSYPPYILIHTLIIPTLLLFVRIIRNRLGSVKATKEGDAS